MKTAVVYCSRSGNTKKIAQAIADAVGAPMFSVSAPPQEPVDCLFVGGGVYAGQLDKKLVDYLGSLRASDAKKLAFFSSSGSGEPRSTLFNQAVKDSAIEISPTAFDCRGRSFLFIGRKHPTAKELEGAAAFARLVDSR